MWFLCNFACSVIYKFAKISPEMKKFLLFICAGLVCVFNAAAAVRGENTATRGKNNTVTTTAKTTRTATSRTPIKTTVSARSVKPISVLTPRTSSRNTATRTSVRSATNTNRTVTARATTNEVISETKTGAAYEQCKTAFFTCMDQFCELKNDSFRRCSCSNRVFDFQDISEGYQQANEQLTEFSDNLDIVGLNKEQVIAMKTASEGEDALTEDKSASKQLLQAIMNSIKGEDSTVGGKYKNLNSITISPDMSNAFGMDDSGQIIASYNGTTLYKAVYPKCRNAVQEDCNTASLQRAVNAYLMAIEQDCNTVEAALKSQQKSLKAATHESSALLDLARVENRKNRNTDDVATCLTNVETAIQSDEVCGENYHKCLDYGQFIDVTTGAPLTGVTDFYKLGELLTFKTDTELKDQKLSSIQNNRYFVEFFESKTKKFAKASLDKCTEDADFVWQQYLDRALIDIYYAQQDKVKTIKQSCLDLVAKCYDNQNTAIAEAMANLTGDSSILLKPAVISLTTQTCQNYIESCNGMFNGDIIKTYIAQKDETDSLAACRAVAQQCFKSFGGTAYNNFYYTQSGLFAAGQAMDWFTLYGKDSNNAKITVSPCAQQVENTPGCENIVKEVFGGFDNTDNSNYKVENRVPYPQGVATEIYYTIIDNLKTQCAGLGGYFVEYKYATQYGYKSDDFCKIDSTNPNSVFYINTSTNSQGSLVYWYHFLNEENMCPLNYDTTVDTQSWGMCSCWENGGYRSKNGTISTCRPLLPSLSGPNDSLCSLGILCSNSSTDEMCKDSRSPSSISYWCQQSVMSSLGQICPTRRVTSDNTLCADDNGNEINVVTQKVPNHTASND